MSRPVDPALARVGATLLGKLRVQRLLGQGAHGAVYEVEHLQTRHRRALKVLHESRTDAEVARLVREAGVAGRTRSPHLAETFDVGRLDDGAPYLLLELLEGRTLRAALDADGPMPPARAAAVVREACAGLTALHTAGLIHRDLKPDNIFLEAPSGRVKLLDLGVVASLAGDSFGALTEDGEVTGTPAYTAPELIEGAGVASARSDLYALGVVLYELLSGQLPTTAQRLLPLILQVRRGELVPLDRARPGLDPALVAVVARALALDPAQRFASAHELRDALAPFAHDGSDPLAGTSLAARYQFVRQLKAGAFGSVHEVIQRDTQRRRALKLLHPRLLENARQRERFLREATVAAGVESEHLVEVIDAGIDAATEQPYLVMELLRGHELGDLLRADGPLDPATALTLLDQAALALDKTHAGGVVHRDIKPQNLFVGQRDDGTPRLKILDFGLALLATSPGEGEGSSGTPLYMAPEQAQGDGEIDGRADLHALAHVAYTMLVGKPYHAPSASVGHLAVLAAIASGPREPASIRAAREGVALPASFDAWFARATALDRTARFASGAAMIAALRQALAPRPRWPLALALALASALALLASLSASRGPAAGPAALSPLPSHASLAASPAASLAASALSTPEPAASPTPEPAAPSASSMPSAPEPAASVAALSTGSIPIISLSASSIHTASPQAPVAAPRAPEPAQSAAAPRAPDPAPTAGEGALRPVSSQSKPKPPPPPPENESIY